MKEVVHLDPIDIAYTNSFGHPSTSDAFKRLEEIVPLKGNKFYATFNSSTKEYCACVEIENAKRAKEWGLPTKVLDGGWYATAELIGPFGEITRKIGPTFDQLAGAFKSDPNRLPIEFYKRHTHIVLYYPIIKSDDVKL